MTHHPLSNLHCRTANVVQNPKVPISEKGTIGTVASPGALMPLVSDPLCHRRSSRAISIVTGYFAPPPWVNFEAQALAEIIVENQFSPLGSPPARPLLAVRPEGANHQWRQNPPRELSIDLEADERLGRVTGRAGAS
jgi:hypothetical protein